MHGAKGVIISIIGGEDMRLLEVDEAANHIREMVDPEANIIWGSAFNPDLQGKIRVSVVATGIDTSGDTPRPSSRPLDLSSVRGPKAPSALRPAAAPALDTAAERRFGALVPDEAQPAEDDALDLTALDAMDDEPAAAEPAASASVMPDPAEQRAFAQLGDGGFGVPAPTGDHPAAADDFDSEVEAARAATPTQDELLLDASRLVDADETVQPGARRRRTIGSGSGEAEEAEAAPVPAKKPASSGSTLFERMANLSRGSSSDDDSDGDDDGGAMRIPRFLGRQNNQ